MYTFLTNIGTATIETTDPEEWGTVMVTGGGGDRLSAQLESSYGAMGNVINLELTTANDIDAALRLLDRPFTLTRKNDASPIKYPEQDQ